MGSGDGDLREAGQPQSRGRQPKFEAELKAFGLAGKCGVLSIRGKYQESARMCSASSHWPIRDKLTSEPMQKTAAIAINRNRAKLGENPAASGTSGSRQFHDEG